MVGLDRPPALPVLRSAFIGRDAEVYRLVKALQNTALLTLVGPAGVGKTRLALEVAARAADRYPDGVRLARLAPVQEPAMVGAAIAASLGIPRTGGRSYDEAMLAWLEERRLLLVLDNCEHVIGSVCELVDTLLQWLPDLTVLTTSLEPLDIEGELVHRVSPLGLPESGAATETLLASEAVQLFLDRARARQDDFQTTLGAVDAEAVGEICRRLDGLPLAIELAAARASALPPRELAARLDDRFRLLVHGLRTAEPRHRTLRAAIEWSYALLAPEEQALFRRLSVFAGGFDLDAAAAVCGDDDLDAEAMVDGVSRLVDKSLVVREGRDRPRYRLLETLRQFGAEQLAAAGEADRLQEAHLRWYVGLAQQAAAALRTGSEAEWLGRLSRDHDNFRAALASLLEGDRPTEVLALAADLSLFWWTHGHAREGIRWFQAGLERAPERPSELVAAALFHLGFLWAHDTGDWAYAATFLDRGIATARAVPDPGTASPLLGYLLALRGECANFGGKYDHALALTREGAEIIRRFPDPWGAGFALWNIGFSHRCRGELADAEACFDEMVAIQRAHGIGLVLMIGCKSLAELAEERGDLSRARALYEEALSLRRGLGAARLGDVHGSLPQALLAVGRVAAGLGDREAARHALAEALPLAEELRDSETLAQAGRLMDELAGDAPNAGAGTLVGDVAAARVRSQHATLSLTDTALGDLLRQYRERRGWSQEELAERIEPAVSPNTISNLERGRTRPYRQTLAALCVALGLDASERQQIEGAWRASARTARQRQAPQGNGVVDPGHISQGTRTTSDT